MEAHERADRAFDLSGAGAVIEDPGSGKPVAVIAENEAPMI